MHADGEEGGGSPRRRLEEGGDEGGKEVEGQHEHAEDADEAEDAEDAADPRLDGHEAAAGSPSRPVHTVHH